LLRGNRSKQANLLVTERFRCHSSACGRVRCQPSRVVRLDVFSDFFRLCGQVGYWGYKLEK